MPVLKRRPLVIPVSVFRKTSTRRELENMFGRVWNDEQLEAEFWIRHRTAGEVYVFNKTNNAWGVVQRDSSGLYHSFQSWGSDRKSIPQRENETPEE